MADLHEVQNIMSLRKREAIFYRVIIKFVVGPELELGIFCKAPSVCSTENGEGGDRAAPGLIEKEEWRG